MVAYATRPHVVHATAARMGARTGNGRAAAVTGSPSPAGRRLDQEAAMGT